MPELHPGLIPDLDNVARSGLVNGFEEGTVWAVAAQVPDSGPARALRKTPPSKVRLVVTPQKRFRMVFSGLFRPCLPSLRRTKSPSVTALQPIARRT
jgi:hypothetical protein